LGDEGESYGFKAGLCIFTLSNFQFFGWHLLENRCKLAYVTRKSDAFVKSQKMPFFVIPAKAGIQ